METPVQIGNTPLHRAGIAPDAEGNPRLCVQGTAKMLNLLDGVAGAAYWPEYNCLSLPLSRTTMRLAETVAQLEEVTPDYLAARQRLLGVPVAYKERYPAPAPEEPDPLPHQIEAFGTALKAQENGFKGFGNFSDMGTGKTRAAIDLMRELTRRCAVVVAQNSTCLQWETHLERSWPEAKVVMLVGCPIPRRVALLQEWSRKLAGSDLPVVFVLNWEALARLVVPLCRLKPCLTVYDEATRLIHRSTQMSKAAFKLAQASVFRVPMTGTLIVKDPTDVFGIFRCQDERLFGTNYRKFTDAYFDLGGFTGHEFIGFKAERLPEFVDRLYAASYRITKAAATDMPERTHQTVKLTMMPKQERFHREIEEKLFAEWQDSEGKSRQLLVSNAMVKVGRLQQITAGILAASETTPTRYERLPSAKTDWTVDYVRDTLADTDAHLVIWTRYREERQALCEALQAAGLTEAMAYIDGTVSMRDREALRRAYNDRQHPLRVLLIQIQAGAMGLDLPAADVMLYHTIPFSLVERCQSMERGHRQGRTRPYQIIDLVCKNSIDGRVLQALKKKQSYADLLMTDGFCPISNSM